jgi:lipoprotein-anchoring transpeptidase ErfK/SrfK
LTHRLALVLPRKVQADPNARIKINCGGSAATHSVCKVKASSVKAGPEMIVGQYPLQRLLWSVLVAAAIVLASSGLSRASASVLVYIDKSSQRMDVVVDGVQRFRWPISTGRGGFSTPSGMYHPQMLARSWFSRRYYNSPMPYSIFFHRGYAIHGTYELSRLGGPASHGCVRLHPYNAAILFSLVREEGLRNTRIVVQ